MPDAVHWMDMSMRNACGGDGRGTIVLYLVTCEDCKATPAYKAAAGMGRPEASRA